MITMSVMTGKKENFAFNIKYTDKFTSKSFATSSKTKSLKYVFSNLMTKNVRHKNFQ